MGTRDPRIDAYIAKSAPFAQPILTYLRSVVHEACPEGQETMKWSAPFFDYRGTLCSMAAFKEHAAFGFWKASLVLGDKNAKAQEAAGHFGRITSISDLPPKRTLIGFIKKAMALNEQAVKPARPLKHPKKPISMPADFRAALKKNKKALTTFESFPPSHKRDYLEWVTTAKGEDTRARRLATAVEWISEGKPRNWKYANLGYLEFRRRVAAPFFAARLRSARVMLPRLVSGLPYPEPPGLFPPPVCLLTVAQARRSASFSLTPCFS